MKYLFFDVECSNCFNGVGKICEFGFVLTDEKFNVIKADDIPMSPGRTYGSRFNLKGRKNEKDLELSYDYDYYLSLPEFPKFYEQIKSLVEDKDTLCFAYSMGNDIRHIANTCKRYNLKPLNYTCYDVQKFATRYLEKKGQISLSKACAQIVGPSATVKLQEHLSRDDAMMEMEIFDAICELTNKTSQELLNESEYAKTNSIQFVEEASIRANRKRAKAKGHELYLSLCATVDEIEDPQYAGKRYNCSGELKSHYKELLVAIDYVKHQNGVFSKSISKTDFFITFDEKNKSEFANGLKRPFEGQIITLAELLARQTNK